MKRAYLARLVALVCPCMLGKSRKGGIAMRGASHHWVRGVRINLWHVAYFERLEKLLEAPPPQGVQAIRHESIGMPFYMGNVQRCR